MDSTLERLITALFPDDGDLPSAVIRVVDRYRDEILRHRRGFSGSSAVPLVDVGDLFLLVPTRSDTAPADAYRLSDLYNVLDERARGVFPGVYLPEAAFRSAAEGAAAEDLLRITGEYRVITDLAPAEGPDLLRPEVCLSTVERLLRYLAAGAQGLRFVLAASSPDHRRQTVDLLCRVMRYADEHALVIVDDLSDAPSPAGSAGSAGKSLVYTASLMPSVRDAVSREDAPAVRDVVAGWGEGNQRKPGNGEGAIPFLISGYRPAGGEESTSEGALPEEQRQRMRFAEHALTFALAGVPGVDIEELAICPGLLDLVRARTEEPGFDPESPQTVIGGDSRVPALLRGEPGTLLCLHNLSGDSISFRDRRDKYPWPEDGILREVITGDYLFPTDEGSLFSLELQPWEVMWLRLGSLQAT